MDNLNIPTLPLREAYPFAKDHGLGLEAEWIRDLHIPEDFPYDSSVRRGYFIELLRAKGLWEEFQQKHWPSGQTSDGLRATARLLRILDRYKALVGTASLATVERPDVDLEGQEFAAEADLRDFLAKNLELVEPGLRLVERDGRSGIEFPVDDGRIDLLAIDRQNRFVVIELKLSRGRNKTLGQLLYYMGWIDKHLGSAPCRGVIIAREISPDLRVATQRAVGISLMSYRLSMTLVPAS